MKAAAIAIISIILSGCYMPDRTSMIIDVRNDEAYYAGFFRGCELLLVDSTQADAFVMARAQDEETEYSNLDLCYILTQRMIDHGAASVYSRNWPGMEELSREYQAIRRMREELPPH